MSATPSSSVQRRQSNNSLTGTPAEGTSLTVHTNHGILPAGAHSTTVRTPVANPALVAASRRPSGTPHLASSSHQQQQQQLPPLSHASASAPPSASPFATSRGAEGDTVRDETASIYDGFVANFGSVTIQREAVAAHMHLADTVARAVDRCFLVARGNVATVVDELAFYRFCYYASLCMRREFASAQGGGTVVALVPPPAGGDMGGGGGGSWSGSTAPKDATAATNNSALLSIGGGFVDGAPVASSLTPPPPPPLLAHVAAGGESTPAAVGAASSSLRAPSRVPSATSVRGGALPSSRMALAVGGSNAVGPKTGGPVPGATGARASTAGLLVTPGSPLPASTGGTPATISLPVPSTLVARRIREIFQFCSQGSGASLKRECFMVALIHIAQCMVGIDVVQTYPFTAGSVGGITHAAETHWAALLASLHGTFLVRYLQHHAVTCPFPEKHFSTCLQTSRVLSRYTEPLFDIFKLYAMPSDIARRSRAAAVLDVPRRCLQAVYGDGVFPPDVIGPSATLWNVTGQTPATANVGVVDRATPYMASLEELLALLDDTGLESNVSPELAGKLFLTALVAVLARRDVTANGGAGSSDFVAVIAQPLTVLKSPKIAAAAVTNASSNAEGKLGSTGKGSVKKGLRIDASARHLDVLQLMDADFLLDENTNDDSADGGRGDIAAPGGLDTIALPHVLLNFEAFCEFLVRLACEALSDDSYAPWLTLAAKVEHFIVSVLGPVYQSHYEREIQPRRAPGGYVDVVVPIVTHVEPARLSATAGQVVTLWGHHMGALGRGAWIYCSVLSPQPVIFIESSQIVPTVRDEPTQQSASSPSRKLLPHGVATATTKVSFVVPPMCREIEWSRVMLTIRSAVVVNDNELEGGTDISTTTTTPIHSRREGNNNNNSGQQRQPNGDEPPQAKQQISSTIEEESVEGVAVRAHFESDVQIAIASAPDDLVFIVEPSRKQGVVLVWELPPFVVPAPTVARMEEVFVEACLTSSVFNETKLYRRGYQLLAMKHFMGMGAAADTSSSSATIGPNNNSTTAALSNLSMAAPPNLGVAVWSGGHYAVGPHHWRALGLLGKTELDAMSRGGRATRTVDHVSRQQCESVLDYLFYAHASVAPGDASGSPSLSFEQFFTIVSKLALSHGHPASESTAAEVASWFIAPTAVSRNNPAAEQRQQGGDAVGTSDDAAAMANDTNMLMIGASAVSTGIFEDASMAPSFLTGVAGDSAGPGMRYRGPLGPPPPRAVTGTAAARNVTRNLTAAAAPAADNAATAGTGVASGELLVKTVTQQRRTMETLRGYIAQLKTRASAADKRLRVLEDEAAVRVAQCGRLAVLADLALDQAVHFAQAGTTDPTVVGLLGKYRETISHGWEAIQDPMQWTTVQDALRGDESSGPPGAGGDGASTTTGGTTLYEAALPSGSLALSTSAAASSFATARIPFANSSSALTTMMMPPSKQRVIPPNAPLSPRLLNSVVRGISDAESLRLQLKGILTEAESQLTSILKQRETESRAREMKIARQLQDLNDELQKTSSSSAFAIKEKSDALKRASDLEAQLDAMKVEFGSKIRDLQNRYDAAEASNTTLRNQLSKAKIELRNANAAMEKQQKEKLIRQREDSLRNGISSPTTVGGGTTAGGAGGRLSIAVPDYRRGSNDPGGANASFHLSNVMSGSSVSPKHGLQSSMAGGNHNAFAALTAAQNAHFEQMSQVQQEKTSAIAAKIEMEVMLTKTKNRLEAANKELAHTQHLLQVAEERAKRLEAEFHEEQKKSLESLVSHWMTSSAPAAPPAPKRGSIATRAASDATVAGVGGGDVLSMSTTAAMTQRGWSLRSRAGSDATALGATQNSVGLLGDLTSQDTPPSTPSASAGGNSKTSSLLRVARAIHHVKASFAKMARIVNEDADAINDGFETLRECLFPAAAGGNGFQLVFRRPSSATAEQATDVAPARVKNPSRKASAASRRTGGELTAPASRRDSEASAVQPTPFITALNPAVLRSTSPSLQQSAAGALLLPVPHDDATAEPGGVTRVSTMTPTRRRRSGVAETPIPSRSQSPALVAALVSPREGSGGHRPHRVTVVAVEPAAAGVDEGGDRPPAATQDATMTIMSYENHQESKRRHPGHVDDATSLSADIRDRPPNDDADRGGPSAVESAARRTVGSSMTGDEAAERNNPAHSDGAQVMVAIPRPPVSEPPPQATRRSSGTADPRNKTQRNAAAALVAAARSQRASFGDIFGEVVVGRRVASGGNTPIAAVVGASEGERRTSSAPRGSVTASSVALAPGRASPRASLPDVLSSALSSPTRAERRHDAFADETDARGDNNTAFPAPPAAPRGDADSNATTSRTALTAMPRRGDTTHNNKSRSEDGIAGHSSTTAANDLNDESIHTPHYALPLPEAGATASSRAVRHSLRSDAVPAVIPIDRREPVPGPVEPPLKLFKLPVTPIDRIVMAAQANKQSERRSPDGPHSAAMQRTARVSTGGAASSQEAAEVERLSHAASGAAPTTTTADEANRWSLVEVGALTTVTPITTNTVNTNKGPTASSSGFLVATTSESAPRGRVSQIMDSAEAAAQFALASRLKPATRLRGWSSNGNAVDAIMEAVMAVATEPTTSAGGGPSPRGGNGRTRTSSARGAGMVGLAPYQLKGVGAAMVGAHKQQQLSAQHQ